MKVREPQIEVGVRVLVKTEQKKKFDPRWDPRSYTVIARKGTMVTASREGHLITCNASFFKPYHYLDDTEIPSSKVQVSLAQVKDPQRNQTQTTQAAAQTISVATSQPTYTQVQTSTPTAIYIPAPASEAGKRKANQPKKLFKLFVNGKV